MFLGPVEFWNRAQEHAELVVLQVSPEAHDKFVLDNDCDGGFFISAQSGENVLTTFYKVAASTAGIQLTAHELAFTEKVCSQLKLLKMCLSRKTVVVCRFAIFAGIECYCGQGSEWRRRC